LQRRLKVEILTTDIKWWQQITWPIDICKLLDSLILAFISFYYFKWWFHLILETRSNPIENIGKECHEEYNWT
jgi:hypothetical protein